MTVGTILLLLAASTYGCLGDPKSRAREHVKRATALAAEGELEAASVEYQAALQKTPHDPEILCSLAEVLERLGQFEQSIQCLRKAAAADPTHTVSRYRLARLYLSLDRYSAALDQTRQLSELEPASEPAIIRLEAKARTALGEWKQARDSWQALLASPDANLSDHLAAVGAELSHGEPHQAEKLLREALQVFPRSALLHAELGGVLSSRDAEVAFRLFDRAQSLQPGDPEIQIIRAQTLARLGRVQDAISSLALAQEAETDPPSRVNLIAEQARLLREQGDLEAARSVLQAALELEPPSHQTQIAAELAQVHLLSGRTRDAWDLLPRVQEHDHGGKTAKLLEARIYMQEGFPRWATRVTEDLMAQGDESVETRLLYARGSARAKRWSEALRMYRLVVSQAPSIRDARMEYAALLSALGDYKGAAALFGSPDEVLGNEPKESYLKASILLGQGDLEGSRRVAAELVEERPNDPVALLLLGQVEREAGKPDEALALFDRAQELHPAATEPLFARVETMQDQGADTDELIQVLEAHMESAGENALVLNRIASLHLEEGDLYGALRRIERSLLLEPNHAPTAVLSARVYLAEGNGAKAVVQLKNAIGLEPLDPEAYNWLAEIYLEQGELEKAEQTYNQLLSQVPDEPQTTNNLANLYVRLERYDEAIALARKALEGAPENPAIVDTLGWALELAGRSEEAAVHLESAQRALADSPEYLLHLGTNLKSRGKREQADLVLRRVVQQAPETTIAERAKRTLASLHAVPD